MIISPQRTSPFNLPLVSGGGFVGLLDEYGGAAAAYSVRRLSSTYEGSLMEVRRSSDNTTQDIGYDSNGDLDTASLLSFVGAGDGFVRTWYDQSGNSNDATQTTTSAQPQIVSSGSYLGYLQTIPVNDNMDTPYSYISGTNYSCFSVFQNNGNCCISSTSTTSHFYGIGQENNTINPSSSFFNITNYYKNSNVIGITRNDMYNETLSFAQFSLLVKSSSNFNLAIGYANSAFANNRFKEYILYPNQTVSRTGVENNQIIYYGLS